MVPPRALTIPGLGPVSWVVAECLPRSEKEVARDLLNAGFDFFLPLVKKTTVSHRHRRIHYVPIPGLEGYIFAASREMPERGKHITDSLKSFLDDHRAVYDIIEIHTAAQPAFVAEITALHGAVMTGKLGENPIGPGTRCRVKHGPFEGKEGVIDSLGKGWAMIPISILGRSVTIEIPVDDLEPIAGMN